MVQNTYAVDHEMSGVTFSDVVLKNRGVTGGSSNSCSFYSIGGNPEDMGANEFRSSPLKIKCPRD